LTLFLKGKIVDFAILAITSLAVGISIYLAGKGKTRQVRPIPALDAVFEGIRRATEMERPVFMSAGFAGVTRAEAAAGLAMLDLVASECAKLGVRLITTFANASTLAAAEGVIAEAFAREGKPELYSPGKQVIFFSGEQFAWVAGVGGMMQRERPACNIYLGTFYSEALYLGECGARSGGVQIAGTVNQLALPVLAMTMDYLMIGEEIYAVAAKLTEDPVQMGSITGQDVGKAVALFILVLGVISMALGSDIVASIMRL